MGLSIYRIIRKDSYEEWIINRLEYVERLLIVFEPEITKLYVVTLDKEFLKNEELIWSIHNLFHFDVDYLESSIEIIIADKINNKILDEENDINVIYDKMQLLKKSLKLI